MLKLMVAVFAMMTLGACASLAPHQLNFASNGLVSFDHDPNAAPVEVWLPREPIAAVASLDASRRRFAPPSQRQPDLRPILATAVDRLRRHARRRRLTCARAQRPSSSAS